MSDIKQLLDFEIYPRIFEALPGLFPEFGFKPINAGFVSTTGQKVTGETGKPGKVYCYRNNPRFLKDYSRGGLSIWDYIQQQQGLNNNDVLKSLADMAGVELPDLAPATMEKIKIGNTRAAIWETAHDFFVSALQDPAAEKCRAYLKQRGYSESEVKEMGIGFLTSQDSLKVYLSEKGFTLDDSTIKLTGAIGKTHQLTITYRDPSGRVKGIAARNIQHKEDSRIGKYLYSSNIGDESLKRDILFNLSTISGDRDLVVVEGLFDCLISTAKGAANVVALGGTSLNETQIKQAIRNGAKKVTLCLDNDKAGRQATGRAIELLLNHDVKIYVAEIPEDAKDPDGLIKWKGIEAFKHVIEDAAPYYTFSTNRLLEGHNLDTIKDLDRLKGDLYSLGLTIKDRTDLDLFCSQVETGTGGVISRESFRAESQKLRDMKNRQEQSRLISELLKDADGFLKTGHIDKARGLITDRLSGINTAAAVDLVPVFRTWDSILTKMEHRKPGLYTGISNLDAICKIPVGQITLIAGRTSHGKTALMLNLMLSMSELYTNKTFIFFTYEEESTSIDYKILNILLDMTDLTDEIYKPTFSKYISYQSKSVTNLEILQGYFSERRTDFDPIEEAKEKFKALINTRRIHVIDSNFSVEELTAVIKHLHGENNDIGAVFVDYAQKIKSTGVTQDKRIEIGEVSTQVLETAKATGLPIIMGAQLNRTAGTGSNSGKKYHKPILSLESLKESGNLEEDANLVISIMQEAREPGFENPEPGGAIKLEIKTLKNRDGKSNETIFLDMARETRKITNRSGY